MDHSFSLNEYAYISNDGRYDVESFCVLEMERFLLLFAY